MTSTTALHAHTDAELLDRAEQGDESAFTALYRRHYAATRRLAYTYLPHGDPDDLVDATFGEVVDGLRAHRRPVDSFGLHLFSTLRRLAGQRPDDTPPGVTGEVPAAVAAVAGRQALGGTDRSTISQAFSALGERWQVVVWHTLIDGCDAAELAYRLGVSPHAAAVQAQRAESKLRQAYLDAHLRIAPRPGCHPHRERLAALHRRALGGADAQATRAHLDRCDSCTNLVADFDRLDERLAWAVVPLFPFVASPGPAAPLAIGFPGQDLSVLDPASGPLPFRSAYGGSPRHMALSPSRGLGPPATGDQPIVPHVESGGDDGERRTPYAAIAGAVAAVLLLIGGMAVALTSLSGGGDPSDDVEVAADVEPSGEASAADPGGRSAAPPSTTAGRPSTSAVPSTTELAFGHESPTSSSSNSSSSSMSSSTSAGPSTSSTLVAAPPATAPLPTTAPTTAPTPLPAPPLVLDSPEWQVTGGREGMLTVAVSRPVPVMAATTAMEPPSDTAVAVTIDTTNDVRLTGSLDSRCDAHARGNGTVSGVISCSLASPAAGAIERLSLNLVVDSGSQRAVVSAAQDGVRVGSETAELVVEDASLLSSPSSTTG